MAFYTTFKYQNLTKIQAQALYKKGISVWLQKLLPLKNNMVGSFFDIIYLKGLIVR
jgi:hypothetical protein